MSSMYPSVRERLSDGQAPAIDRRRWPRVARNVWLLGLTSLFTDVSSEMFAAVLPLYVMVELKLTPLHLGVVDGLYQGVSALVRVAAGTVADARRRYKAVAVAGYGLSTVSRIGLLFAGGWTGLTSFVLLDRLGKGIRTAPRDALLALSSERGRLGEAFGVHRAMDAVGAALGPLLAFVILALTAQAYDAVFVVSLAFSVIGLALIGLFVENRAEPSGEPAARSWDLIARLLKDAAFRRITVAGGVLGAFTATDALIYTALERQGAVALSLFPLLFVGTSTVYFLLAVPMGQIGDRVGRGRLFLAGHVAVLGIYAVLGPFGLAGASAVLLTVLLLGTYYAMTDGVLAALAASVLSKPELSTGLAVVSTAFATARLVAAILFGAVWNSYGQNSAMALFLGLLTIGIGVAAWHLRHIDREARQKSTSP
jgi:MFS family permease